MGPYQIIRQLGEGGFGLVSLAKDTASGTLVAIKQLKKLDSSSLKQFGRELRLLREEINNRFVVDVLDFNLSLPAPFIVMEYCNGGSLRSWVKDRKPWLDVVGALGCVAEGLAGIHKAGGFHRDIKPDNLLLVNLGDEAVVKVSDFGLARVPHGTGTMTYSPGGTQGYIAPEIMMGDDFHSGADIYSLGMVAIELLTGELNPALLERADAPLQLKTLAKAMISRSPAKRPNIQQVARELQNIIHPAVGTPDAPQTAPNARRATASQNSGAGAAAAIGIGVALLAALGGLAYLASNSPEWDERVQRYRGKDGRFR